MARFLDWWAHKLQHIWILPAIMKSQSKITPEDWDISPATTNIGEAQHHWTNRQTGTRLSLREAIKTYIQIYTYLGSKLMPCIPFSRAQALDEKTAAEIENQDQVGFIGNAHNETFHRTGRNSQRASDRMRKAKAHDKQVTATSDLWEQIEREKNARKESMLRQKAMQEELSAAQTSGGKKSKVPRAVKSIRPSTNENQASSSGRVCLNAGKKKAREVADPYPICELSFTITTDNGP
jgi:hypothetical protein